MDRGPLALKGCYKEALTNKLSVDVLDLSRRSLKSYRQAGRTEYSQLVSADHISVSRHGTGDRLRAQQRSLAQRQATDHTIKRTHEATSN